MLSLVTVAAVPDYRSSISKDTCLKKKALTPASPLIVSVG
ncbi:hypothetical protein NQ315_010607 [Exocentrus adspersus]|uniref:Uncharacterized protein n=1 Tax=Exocentrus adspersus TaxID=1586481 RepID=A0AAV8W6E0_9CUCU|nr:hypothetical protein NQ315_010607 [Exocentrus adspersus]